MGAVVLFVTGTLFMEGLRTVAQAGLNPQNIVMVGLAYAVGVGMLQHNVLEGLLPKPWDLLIGDGLTLGAATAVGLSLFLKLTGVRPRRLRAPLDASALPLIDGFLRDLAAERGWDPASSQRLRSAGEEALSSLLQQRNAASVKLIVSAYSREESVKMEFVTALDDENLEDRLAYLGEEVETWDETELSFVLLRHYASEVRHHKYHGLDVVTVKVDRR